MQDGEDIWSSSGRIRRRCRGISEPSIHRLPHRHSPGSSRLAREGRSLRVGVDTCVVAGLLALITLLVGFGLGLVRLTLLSRERLPFFTEDLANLAWMHPLYQLVTRGREESLARASFSPKVMPGFSLRTLSRCSLAKNIYAERPRLGALGSIGDIDQPPGLVPSMRLN